MSLEWVLIEFAIVMVECTAMFYFLESHLISRYHSKIPQIVLLVSLIIIDLFITFTNVNGLEFAAFIVILIYAVTSKYGGWIQKTFIVIFDMGINLGSSLLAFNITTMLSGRSANYLIENQDESRLMLLILVATIQVILYYMLSRKRSQIRKLPLLPMFTLIFVAFLNFSCILLLHYFAQHVSLESTEIKVIVFISMGFLLTIVSVFVIYELFIYYEHNNIKLATQLHHNALEKHFFHEIDTMYADMRAWRHDYKNHIISLLALAEANEHDRLEKYLKQMMDEPSRGKATLNTGNLALDAIVSSKLLLAQSKDIDITIQSEYPEENKIADSDLCSIAGNLLDNAIEACGRISDKSQRKFIDFSIVTKRKNMIISVRNSADSSITTTNGRYQTSKMGRYHGIGLLHVENIVNKYQGYILNEPNRDIFETHVLLPLLAPKEDMSDV